MAAQDPTMVGTPKATGNQAGRLQAELEALNPLQPGDVQFKRWQSRTRTLVAAVAGTDEAKHFSSIRWGPLLITSSTPRSVWESAFNRGKQTARGFLEGLILAYEPIAPEHRESANEQWDSALWTHVSHLAEAGQWLQVASQAEIFFESELRSIARFDDGHYGTVLVNAALRPNGGLLSLGQTSGEREGWHRLALGITQALGNVDRHRIQSRQDVKRYAFGVLGVVSLVLTELRANSE